MNKLFTTLLLGVALSCGAATYTEFYVQTTGSNLNSGHTPDDTATFTAASGYWTNATATFFKSGLNPVAGGVTNGAWASIYADAGSVAAYVGLVTNVDDTADIIQLSQVAVSGSKPADDTAGATSVKIGGAWKGPNAAVAFPFNFLAGTATNAPNVFPRCNIKSNALYSITSAMTHSIAGPCIFRGYTNTVGDGGMANIDGPTTGTSFVLLTLSANDCVLENLIFSNNGNSGSAAGLLVQSGSRNILNRVVCHDAHRSGFSCSSSLVMNECEAYNCNKSNNGTSTAGISLVGGILTRCISHDNTTTATDGFYVSGTGLIAMFDCISDSNGRNGFNLSDAHASMIGCDAYSNATNGIFLGLATPSTALIQNCNLVKNGLWGIDSSTSSLRSGAILNCGFGAGTQANGSGTVAANVGAITELGTVTYAADQTPWADPANGDFRITLTAAKSAGRGAFTQTASSYAGTVAYPDIGAAQSVSTNGAAAGGGSYTFAQ